MGLRDATNATEPTVGYNLSGDATRQAAIRRLKKLQEQNSNVQSLIPPSRKA